MRPQETTGKVQTETFVRNESSGDLKKRAQVRATEEKPAGILLYSA